MLNVLQWVQIGCLTRPWENCKPFLVFPGSFIYLYGTLHYLIWKLNLGDSDCCLERSVVDSFGISMYLSALIVPAQNAKLLLPPYRIASHSITLMTSYFRVCCQNWSSNCIKEPRHTHFFSAITKLTVLRFTRKNNIPPKVSNLRNNLF